MNAVEQTNNIKKKSETILAECIQILPENNALHSTKTPASYP